MEYNLISPLVKGQSKIQTILNNRGIIDIEHYLNTTEEDILSPTLIDRIDDGIKMLAKHIRDNDSIYIQIDEDCDGYTSSSILINYLYRLFPSYVKENVYYGVHSNKAHGINKDQIPPWVKLIIVPDASSNEYDLHKEYYNNGIDVLLIDHHEAPEVSKYACVINNQLCDYPTKSLSGAGMVYKFCSRFDEIMGTDFAKDYRDLAALGCCGDMMDLRDFETVELVREGFDNIKNPFFLEMIDRNKTRFTSGITISSIAFYVVPYINAVTRVGTVEERMLMFDSMLEFKANTLVESTKRGHKGEQERLVEQATRMCSNLKQTKQTNAMTLGYDQAEALIKTNNLLNDKFIIVQMEDKIVDADINGLIANKLMSKYQRPVMILRYNDGYWAGSGRGYDKGGLADFRKFLEDSGLVEYAQGHANAFGVCIKDENIEVLKEYSKEKLKDIEFTPNYQVDFIWDIEEMKAQDVYDIADLNYLWGQSVDEPLVAIENIKVNADTLKFFGASGNTLRLTSGCLSFVKFNVKEEEKILLDPGSGFYTVDIVGRCARNFFNDMCTPQIQIEDIRIRNRKTYYF